MSQETEISVAPVQNKTTEQLLSEHLGRVEDRFKQLDEANGKLVHWPTEHHFAIQQIMKSDRALQTARNNKGSVRAAMVNVAAVGLSLNPANQHAFLVPRDGRICLDISYRGLIKLATDSGMVEWVRADLVYSEDRFEYLGPAEKPEHRANVFGDRGTFIGVYCIAKLASGEHLTEVMTDAEITEVQRTSKAANGPWKKWFGEMAKKTVIKRASKTWPQSGGRERMDKAVHVINEHEGLSETRDEEYTPDQRADLMRIIEADDALEYIAFLSELDQGTETALFNCGEPGKKSALKERMRSLSSAGVVVLKEVVAELAVAQEGDDPSRAAEVWSELSARAQRFVRGALPQRVIYFIEDHLSPTNA